MTPSAFCELAANAQSKKTENYKKQVSRTPYIIWDWVDEDSTRAYQDTIPGIMKFFHKDEFEGERWESVHYFYDEGECIQEKLLNSVRDWNSFDLDTMYYSDLLVKFTIPIVEILFVLMSVHPMASCGIESYTVDSSTVIMDDVYLDLDTLKVEKVVFHLMYMRIIEDTLYPENEALYDPWNWMKTKCSVYYPHMIFLDSGWLVFIMLPTTNQHAIY